MCEMFTELSIALFLPGRVGVWSRCYWPFFEAASPKLLGLIHDIVKHVGAHTGPAVARYSVGFTPTMSRNVRLKLPRLANPTSRHTSVMLRSVSRSRNIAR